MVLLAETAQPIPPALFWSLWIPLFIAMVWVLHRGYSGVQRLLEHRGQPREDEEDDPTG